MCGLRMLRRRRLASAMTRMRSALACAGSQRTSRSESNGRNHRKAHLCDKSAALWVHRKTARVAGVAKPHMTTPSMGKGTKG